MIGQCLSNKNESVTVSKSKKFLDLNKPSMSSKDVSALRLKGKKLSNLYLYLYYII